MAGPHKNSWNGWLLTFSVGERRYVGVDVEEYKAKMRIINTPKSRRPESLKGLEFTTSLFTAVAASKIGDIRYLICVERTK